MIITDTFPTYVPEGQAIFYVAKQRKIACHSIFLAAAGKAALNKLPPDERLEILNFAKAACRTKNPDIIWQIALVESSFKMRVIQIEGKKVLTGNNAKEYLENGLSKEKNVDIGPLQINWRANGAHSGKSPIEFLSGQFSVDFLSNKILRNYVKSCGNNWINCYHSYNEDRGRSYRSKIQSSGLKLRKILSDFL
ncbi:transglycosylase SLT domain-containing protein [Fluviispira multicolorata]|uniref:Transglycosylase SLT domain-containing protein n=1 Tax=Fluviispira multicolorata TaxID=2654512 RepID=A0A833N4K5_9BACT|nr:transglycosylase SLT domain-containing protein [Fluviispira multicolorata]KAB8030906.1 transglycosylase SLT domain-containing protein [Fluviispira multicolorata]